MKNLEKNIAAFKNEKIEFSIYTTAVEWNKSSICWDNEIDDGYIYQVNFIPNNIHVCVVPEKEFENKVYNSEYTENIKKDDEDLFFSELVENEEIFGLVF